MSKKIFLYWLVAGFGLLSSVSFVSCYSSSIADDPSVHKEIVDEWLKRTYKDPGDSEALKNLGIFYVQANEQVKAKIYLDRALEELPDDPALHFYKGLNLEFFNSPVEALTYYSLYKNLDEGVPFRDMLEGRYLWLQRQNEYADIRNIISNEEQIATAVTSDSTIAVFPLIYRGTNPDYVPLSRGFSEMISIDLAKVPGLTVLERVRIQAVLDELSLSKSPAVEKSTAPRAGRILRAGTIVSGDFDIPGNQEFTINLGSWETSTSQQKVWVNKEGDINDLFEIQKQLVFNFLEKSRIEITQEQKEAIAYIPTKNLESFLAYSKGLLLEDSGNYKDAGAYFQRALELDPGFNAAQSKLNISRAVGNAGGDKTEVVLKMENEDPVTKKVITDIEADRLENTVSNISSGFMPGVNNRSPSEEKSLYQESGKLPDPPPPPVR